MRSDAIEAKQWQDVHAAREWGSWPETSIVRFIARHYGHVSRDDRRNIKFLDIGCGAGATTRFLAIEGFSVVAIDVAKSALDRLDIWLRGNPISGHVDLIQGNAGIVAFAADMFDAAIDVCTLQHVGDPLLVLMRTYWALKPGGRIFSIWASDAHSHDLASSIAPCHRLRLDEAYATFHPPFVDMNVERERRTDGRHTIAHWHISGRKPAVEKPDCIHRENPI